MEEKPGNIVDITDRVLVDKELIVRASEGDKDAFGRLVLKYQKKLFRFLFMMLGKKDATEDITQEAFVKAYMALGSFNSEKAFYPWVATIARNLAINYLKRNAKEKPASEYDDFLVSRPDTAGNPLDHLLEKEADKKLAEAIAMLPQKYRVVFVMRMFEKMSYEDIARQLSISVGTVDSRIFRAREKLMQMLKDYI